MGLSHLKFGEILRDDGLFVNVRYDTAKKLAYFVEDLGYTGSIFAIFSPYESALHADDGFVPCFQIYQGTLDWINLSQHKRTLRCCRYIISMLIYCYQLNVEDYYPKQLYKSISY